MRPRSVTSAYVQSIGTQGADRPQVQDGEPGAAGTTLGGPAVSAAHGAGRDAPRRVARDPEGLERRAVGRDGHGVDGPTRPVGRDARDEAGEAGRLGAAELRVLEIDVVDDLGDRTQRRVRQLEALDEHLEPAQLDRLGVRYIDRITGDAVDDIAARYNLTVARTADDAAHRDVTRACAAYWSVM